MDVSGTRDLFATAAHDPARPDLGVIGVWDGSGASVGAFRAPWSIGGRRLRLVPGDRPTIVSAAYHREGIAGHRADGAEFWRRRDLKKTHVLATLEAPSRPLIGVYSEKGALLLLSPTDGRTAATIRSWKKAFGAGRGHVIVARDARWALATLSDLGAIDVCWRREAPSFAVLDAAANDTHVAVAAVNAPLVCCTLRGEPSWEWSPGNRGFVTQVRWSATRRRWIAMAASGVWAIDEAGLDERLRDGGLEHLLDDGSALVASDGRFITFGEPQSSIRIDPSAGLTH